MYKSSYSNKKKLKRLIFSVSFMFIIIFALYKLNNDFKPVLIALCDAQARIITSETINGTIREEFGNKISYDDLMTVKTDKDGNVVMIQANTVELNRIGSQVALSVQNRIRNSTGTSVKIPIGVLLRNDMFAYYGPKVTFRMQPAGSVNTTYRSEFQAAGINQTRQIIYLDVTINLQVVIPLARNSITTTSSIPIAESIIIGKVPNTYANFENMGGEILNKSGSDLNK